MSAHLCRLSQLTLSYRALVTVLPVRPPVQVRHVVIRDRVIDHVGDIVDVDAASCDVRGDHDILLARFERRHRTLALLLTHVAVHAAGAETAVAQLVDER